MIPLLPARLLLGALALAVLAPCAAPADAALRTVYRGTLEGAGDVVMELDSEASSGGTLTGRYFYPKHGVDIPLKGTPEALTEPRLFQDLAQAGIDPDTPAAAAATWQGRRDADGYRGRWIDARTGRPLPTRSAEARAAVSIAASASMPPTPRTKP
ncbi:hypothetical protein [Achromobacter sp. JUb104]|uniref:hypothetical protein n=1 Tax=Achromobacter sp. JUb104 TaxID=2940590 RepID=UPI00286E6B47|nr:hypothetical protein [Achromobacter sp. JUb104]MCS3505323.1 hypothetical protein [Achromobacter sp. JUb104]